MISSGHLEKSDFEQQSSGFVVKVLTLHDFKIAWRPKRAP
jgi:hypothetical protein